jgi:hypothetical protein
VTRLLLVLALAAVVAPAASAHAGKGFRAAELPVVKARFEAYLEANIEKRMFVRDVFIDCRGSDAVPGRRFRHVRCAVEYGAEMDHRRVCRVYHRTPAGAVVSTACPRR